jgi:hypothetical protein
MMLQRLFCLTCLVCPLLAAGQTASPAPSSPRRAGDRIESTSYNEHRRAAPRTLQYRPDGDDFVCVNGKNRFTRALYGAHTPFRLETSDRPVFALFEKSANSRNIRFRMRLPDGTSVALDSTAHCEARYTPGRRSYQLAHPAWGKGAGVHIAALALYDEDAAIWKITPTNMPPGATLRALICEISRTKLNRNGDMGADPPGCFEAPLHPRQLQTVDLPLRNGETCYLLARNYTLHLPDSTHGERLYNRAEAQRTALTNRIRITTPDPYINPLGGAIAVAADAIWDGQVWLHGAVGWRMPLTGWRAAYTGDALGWHDRARTHFDAYAASQVTGVPCTIPHPAQDSALALARSLKRWGTPQYSNGYICRNPYRNNQMHHYDMNLCYIDELLWHLNWTGDLDYARRMWQVITRSLAWEKRNFDPDDDALYDAYACIWASDALYYNSGAVTHSSAYNYRANRLAALIAAKIGEDPAPYQREAGRILDALNRRLWLDDEGHWAEYQDALGHRRLHKNAAVWSIYHAIDSDAGDAFQAYRATEYIDRHIPHIPVRAEGLDDAQYATISTTNWMPYAWSINNVAFAEVWHTALAYFQAGRADAAYQLFKSSVLDGMYLGDSPANFGQVSFYDAARGECYRDFGDPVGIASRLLIQGLFGIVPDALNQHLLVRPGFPRHWTEASLHTPDIDFTYHGGNRYTLTHRLPTVTTVELRIPARRSRIAALTVNGQPARWEPLRTAIDNPVVCITATAKAGETLTVAITWGGNELNAPAIAADNAPAISAGDNAPYFRSVTQDDMTWWLPTPRDTVPRQPIAPMFARVDAARCEPVPMDAYFNASVTDIYRNQYRSPRSPYTTLQIPVQGIGEWCHPLHTVEIDDTGLRASVRPDGTIATPLGIPFRTPREGKNILFTSLWDNYPDSIAIPLTGHASSAYLLMAGSTNHMQFDIDNATVRIDYTDGSSTCMPLVNPTNWASVEHLFFEDGLAFNRHAPALYRLHLKTGRVSNRLGEETGFTGASRELAGGAAILLEMPLDPTKTVTRLLLETRANDVVVGLMGVTLQR